MFNILHKIFEQIVNRLTFAPIWLPHWPAWMWTISLMVEWLPRARVESLPAGGGVSRALPNLPPASFPEQPTATPCHLYSPGKGSNYTKSIQGRQGTNGNRLPVLFFPRIVLIFFIDLASKPMTQLREGYKKNKGKVWSFTIPGGDCRG